MFWICEWPRLVQLMTSIWQGRHWDWCLAYCLATNDTFEFISLFDIKYRIWYALWTVTSYSRYLGATLSDDLKWSSQISKITKKANSTLGFLKTLPSKLQDGSIHLTYLINTWIQFSDLGSLPSERYWQIRKCTTPGCKIYLRKLHFKGSWLCYTDDGRFFISHHSKSEGRQTAWYSSSRWSRGWCRYRRPMTIWHQFMINAKLNLSNSKTILPLIL